MKKFLLSVAILTAATLTVHAGGKPGNGGNKNAGKNAGMGGGRPIQVGGAGGFKIGTGGKQPIGKVGNGSNQPLFQMQPVVKHAINGKDFKHPQVLNPKVNAKDYHLQHARKHHYGFCYHGHQHHHWSHRCWFDQYGCHCHWCPAVRCWYYWCAWDSCWYPVSYCPYGRYTF